MIRYTSFLFFALKATVAFVVFYNHFKVQAFVPKLSSSSSSAAVIKGKPFTSQPLFADGIGMGMGTKTSTKKKNKKGGKKSNSKAFSSSSSSSSSSSKSPFDVNASLLRMEKKYDEIMLSLAKEQQKTEEEEELYNCSFSTPTMMTSEYIVAARGSSKRGSVPDWVPIAQVCLKRPESEYQDGASDEMVKTAISVYCRELSYLATMGAPVFSTMARNEIQYSVENKDSWFKHVYEGVVEGNANKSADQVMTKMDARKALGLIKEDDSTTSSTDEITKSDIKKAYRNLCYELHPDRFEGTPEECLEARDRFGRVTLAYETLSSGVRGEEGMSWYESLGGRERTGFVGPINLLPLGAAQEHMTRHNAEGACLPLNTVMVQTFVARHLRSA
jgi:hypothetical protein